MSYEKHSIALLRDEFYVDRRTPTLCGISFAVTVTLHVYVNPRSPAATAPPAPLHSHDAHHDANRRAATLAVRWVTTTVGRRASTSLGDLVTEMPRVLILLSPEPQHQDSSPPGFQPHAPAARSYPIAPPAPVCAQHAIQDMWTLPQDGASNKQFVSCMYGRRGYA